LADSIAALVLTSLPTYDLLRSTCFGLLIGTEEEGLNFWLHLLT